MAIRHHNLRWQTRCASGVRGFTVVEMLIVVAIIILLLSILIVVVSAAARAGQTASTSVRMQAMSRALVTFKKDLGYYPPVLDDDRNLTFSATHDPLSGSYANDVQNYFSHTSMAEYLVGYGPRTQDGFGAPIGNNTDSERPPFGIRDPGNDGVWDAVNNPLSGQPANGSLTSRNPKFTGDIFGPYLELDDSRLLGSIDGSAHPVTGAINVFFPGEAGYSDTDPKVIVDYWGRPIRYYRRPYPFGGLRTGYGMVDRDGNGTIDRVPSLGDIFLLRPFNLPPGTDVSSPFADAAGDNASTTALNAAEFALFSSGPDLTFNALVRYDDPDLGPAITTEFSNRDNIVEVGP